MWGYRCLGLKYLANWIPVTAVDGSGLIRFNVDISNYDDYIPSNGQPNGRPNPLLLPHPTLECAYRGRHHDRLDDDERPGLCSRWYPVKKCNSRAIAVVRNGVGNSREGPEISAPPTCVTALFAWSMSHRDRITLMVGTDPIDPPMLSRNWTNPATRTICRGRGIIEAVDVGTNTSPQSLTPAWMPPNKPRGIGARSRSPPGPWTAAR